MLKNSTLVKILINSSIGALLLFIWSRFVDFSSLIEELANIDYRYLAFFFVLFALAALMRAIRLKYLLSLDMLRLKDIWALNLLSQFLSFIIPIRAGEISKGVYLSSQCGIPFSKSLTWVFIDRFIDFWVVLVSISLLILVVPTTLPDQFVKILLGMLTVFTLCSVLALYSGPSFIRFITKVLTILETIFKFLRDFALYQKIKGRFLALLQTVIEGFDILRLTPLKFAFVFLVTVVAYTFEGLTWYFVLQAFRLDLGVIPSVLGNMMFALSFIIPSGPGYVGSAHAAGLAVFGGVLGVDSNVASAAVVVFHAMTVVAALVFGLASLYFLKFDLGLVWRKIKSS